MVTFNKSEEEIYKHIKKKRRKVSLEELTDWFYSGRKRPKNAHGSMAAMMRTLMLKCAAMKIKSVVRDSGLGRGNTAVYKIE